MVLPCCSIGADLCCLGFGQRMCVFHGPREKSPYMKLYWVLCSGVTERDKAELTKRK